MKIDTSNTVFVFDLDDTLYREVDYCYSGFSYISNVIKNIYRVDILKKLIYLFKAGRKDIFDEICRDLKLSIEVKESLVWMYRTHIPSIELLPSTLELIRELESNSSAVCILSDGRSLTQRLKMSALELGHIPSYISEEYGEIKPGLKRYKLIQDIYQKKEYIYVGDNPSKDFIAPNILGWLSIGIKGGDWNIHPQNINKSNIEYQPSIWINDIEELREFLC